MNKRTKILTLLFVTLGIIVFAYCICALILPFVLLAHSDTILKEDLDNRYIDSGYRNWKRAESGFSTDFLIPDDWFLISSSNMVYIEDGEGNIIATGTLLGKTESEYSSRLDFLGSLLGTNVSDIAQDIVPGFVPIKGSAFGKVLVTDDNGDHVYYYLSLVSISDGSSEELYFVFSNELSEDCDTIVEITQAIVYSYGFPMEDNHTN